MDYFTNFPGFSLRKGEHMRNAFKRLAKSKGWSEKKRATEREIFHRSVVQDLNTRFIKLEHYQNLCKELFDDVPSTITQCKKLLTSKYVNIWDIVEGRYRYFEEYKEFRSYTHHDPVHKRIPVEVWVQILSYPYPSQLSRVQMVNKNFSSIVSLMEV
ncbi:hypothetical protein BGZ95_009726 [Linnemannia exigua]|uniref:F-box domain-containing protein n=1 Tax=Linnemannia exigua TaxID=604196 RepID=A0AAD4DCG1_9FUNG|nr:hypothetical protein BGZ95_009726 [Linnemannia exigua]